MDHKKSEPRVVISRNGPYIVGGGTEHMVKIAAPRGGANHQVLDAPEGVDAEESTIAKQLGVITSQVAENREQEGYLSSSAPPDRARGSARSPTDRP